ncbi:ribose transport system permease protein [Neomicrococcus aestuarii]|uniref:Ribose transport system permease protein n=1 Tax=Neomicrococcus aestuarii TaxID=556325 RepID=A0A7W8WYE6_9MICC|nr:ABC transporter permease [Neomicrococcus aestuarii]MBB5512241.1 ribose transport system permease protein [Neomicrococcus aestuarii]
MSIDQKIEESMPRSSAEIAEVPSASASSSVKARPRITAQTLTRAIAPVTLGVILFAFSVMTPTFLTSGNLVSVISQMALLALVATGLTIVIRAGGIDLSIGVALDLGALASAALIYDGYRAWVAVVGGLLAALIVGLINAGLVVLLRIPPFLATLSIWFVGTSVQQLFTSGGAPIYLSAPRVPEGFAVIGRGYWLEIDAAVINFLVVAVVVGLLLGVTRFGRRLTHTGEQPGAALLSGLKTKRLIASSYVLCSLIAGFAGVILASRTNSFVPGSGQAYLMDAIGAVCIGATLSRFGRVSVPGTLVGVLIFALLSNGMNLIGLSFFWQGLGRGIVLLAILVIAALLAKQEGRTFELTRWITTKKTSPEGASS